MSRRPIRTQIHPVLGLFFLLGGTLLPSLEGSPCFPETRIVASGRVRPLSHQATKGGNVDPVPDARCVYDDPASAFSYRWYFHQNNVGSVTRMTNGGGTTANSYTYSAYGEERSATEAVGNRFRYTGREWDPRAKLYQYRSRWYHPQTAHFTQYDPIGHDGGINLLGYGAGNPVEYRDPSGLFPIVIPAGVALGGLIIAAGGYLYNQYNSNCPATAPWFVTYAPAAQATLNVSFQRFRREPLPPPPPLPPDPEPPQRPERPRCYDILFNGSMFCIGLNALKPDPWNFANCMKFVLNDYMDCLMGR